MKAFRNSPPHRKAMQKLPVWCNEAAYVHWLSESPDMPDLDTIYTKMMAEGKPSKVRYPSTNQQNKSYPPFKWTIT
jgi:hypothetical protein